MLRQIWSDNPWVPPAFAAGGIIATFLVAGWRWGVGLLAFVTVLVIIALLVSLRKATSSGAAKATAALPAAAETARPEAESTPTGEASREAQEGAALGEAGSDAEARESEPRLEVPLDLLAELAAREGDYSKTRDAADKFVGQAQDDRDRRAREAFRYRVLALAGDSSAVSALRQLADANADHPDVIRQLAQALAQLGETVSAAREVHDRMSGVAREHQPSLAVVEARLRRQGGQPEEAIAVARQMLGWADLAGAQKAPLLAELGYSLYARSQYELAFVNFEESLALDPAQTSVRFDLAWRYAEQGWHLLAMTHYEVLAEAAKPNSTAMNNLAVEYERLGMPGRRAVTFRKAMDAGSARAAGNYAHLSLDANLVDQTQSHLDRGRELDLQDARVESAAARLARDTTAEEDQLEKLRTDARRARTVIERLLSSDKELPSGLWEFTPGGRVEIESSFFGSADGVGAGTPAKVSLFERDDIGPAMIRWTEGELQGYEGPFRVSAGLLEAVLLNTKTGKVVLLTGRSLPTGTQKAADPQTGG